MARTKTGDSSQRPTFQGSFPSNDDSEVEILSEQPSPLPDAGQARVQADTGHPKMLLQGYSELDTRPQSTSPEPTFSLPEQTGNQAESDERLAGAFAIIKEHLEAGGQFSFEQMDMGVELSLRVLPKPDQEWFKEIAHTHGIPFWQCLWAQWRRNQENGLANALVLDPGWRGGQVVALTKKECKECHQIFEPERWGQDFCTNFCGAQEERRRLGMPPREELLVKAAPAETKEETVTA